MKLFGDLLQSQGYVIFKAYNGEEGVLLAQQKHPDLILMDVQMPVKDGVQATKEIKADPATRLIPVIALTAFAMKGDREQLSNEGGFDGYISKPINIHTFLKNIAEYFAP